MAVDDRRADIYGSWYREIQQIRRIVREDAAVDIVMVDSDARDIAVFAGAALAPRDCRYFAGWDAYVRRKRADFLLDSRAANAIAGQPPGVAAATVVIDSRRDPPIRMMARGGR